MEKTLIDEISDELKRDFRDRKKSEDKIIEEKEEYELTVPSWEYMKYLGDENLLTIINKEFDKFIAGEENTREAIFVCNCANFVANLNSHFNLLINGNSSAGKSWTAKKVLEIFPESVFSRATYRTRISQKALTYWHNKEVEPDWTWDGKTLYLEDIGDDVLNCDVFKVMTSEGSVATIVAKSKRKNTELSVTIDIEIVGKPTIVITTAIGTPIEEIKNRFLMIDLDESEQQTDRIMEMQTQWALSTEIPQYNEILRKSLGYLKRVKVRLPKWITHIKDNLPRKDILRWRREFPRFLDIIKCSCALHQYQREKDDLGFYLADERDYEIARRVIGKISSSSGIEGLNHREKMAYQYILEYYRKGEKGCTRNEIYAFKPIYTDRYWATLLEKLAGKGLLSAKLEKNPDTNRKVIYFYPTEFRNLELPSVVELMELISQNIQLLQNNKGFNWESGSCIPHAISSFSSISPELIKASGLPIELIEKAMKEVEMEKNEVVEKVPEKPKEQTEKEAFFKDMEYH